MAKRKAVVTGGSRGRLYVSQQGNEIRLTYRQGKHGVWRKFIVNFAVEDEARRCQPLGTTKCEREARNWALETEVDRVFDEMDHEPAF